MSNTESPGIAPTTAKPVKTESALTKLINDSKGKKVNESDKKKITNDFVKSMGERQKLQAALDAFDAKADDTAANMVRCYGSAHVIVAGVKYIPTCRGEKISYKKMSDETKTVIALD